ncbi:MAG: hypothetical protein AMJ54_00660 [Deltaproteobacteria bacterium SG8_13]|nr:MAG: hypothetical protein AMJ54_00660 [Deltaproteobacteria bacterium SG8_13]
MKSCELTGWFARLLDRRLLPALERIGFEKGLARSVMSLAAPAWEQMGPLPASGIRIHPGLTRTIEEIRTATGAECRRQSENQALLDGLRPSELRSLAAASAEPAGLSTLVEHVAACWLILPRASRTLTMRDSHCLPIYLPYLDGRQDPGFSKALCRVVIEYIGNFSLTYRRPDLPREETAAALFFGFAAMFWKNLRQPPAGRQHDMICDHFFQWAQRLYSNTPLPCAPMDEAARDMSCAFQWIFPRPDAFGRIPAVKQYHPQASLIALRNGEHGIVSVLRCLAPSATLFKRGTAAKIPYAQVPANLQSLLRTIKSCWSCESPATRRNIRCFLTRLANRYRIGWQNAKATNDPAAPVLRFTASRTIEMIHSFTASLSGSQRE